MTKHCCNTKAVTCFKFLSQSTIEKLRSTVYSVSETEQAQMILNYMVNHSQGDRSVLYTVGGQIVCESCFRMVYGFRYNRFSSMKSKFLDGVLLIAEHGRLGRSETRDASHASRYYRKWTVGNTQDLPGTSHHRLVHIHHFGET